jgi:hypothetical protein
MKAIILENGLVVCGGYGFKNDRMFDIPVNRVLKENKTIREIDIPELDDEKPRCPEDIIDIIRDHTT